MISYRSASFRMGMAVCCAGLFLARTPIVRADPTDSDRDFVRQATEEVMDDAEINRVAREKAEHEEVRHYAAERVHMDEKLESELRDIADRHHIGVPGKGDMTKSFVGRLEGIKNAEHFDRTYLKGEMEDSGEMTKLFKKASDGETDRELRGWFDSKADTLKDQHEKLKVLDDRFDK